MAIDTAAKRNSALLDPGNLPWPPDGTIAAGDRLVMLEFYSGIVPSTVEARGWELAQRRRTWNVPGRTRTWALDGRSRDWKLPVRP